MVIAPIQRQRAGCRDRRHNGSFIDVIVSSFGDSLFTSISTDEISTAHVAAGRPLMQPAQLRQTNAPTMDFRGISSI